MPTAAEPEPSGGLPLFTWILAGITVYASLGGPSLYGYNASGLAWVVILAVSFVVVARNPSRVTFPLWTFTPWIAAVTICWYQSRFPALQRSVQMLCPLAVGAAASTYRLDDGDLRLFVRLVKGLAVALIAIVVLKSGMLATWMLPATTGLAPQVMTVMLLDCLFAALYVAGDPGALRWWLGMALIPVVALTRTAIVGTALTLPLCFAPLRLGRRLLLLAAVALVGWGLFHTPRVQRKMFKSGSGEMTDLLHKDFADSGRFFMWEMMRQGIRNDPWLGHGAGAGELFVRSITVGRLAYPHNDWLLTLYDYGVVGTAALVISMLAVVVHAVVTSRQRSGVASLLLLAGAASFLPFAMLMYTDNILVYVSYFGNLQFAFLGLGYGALKGAPAPGAGNGLPVAEP